MCKVYTDIGVFKNNHFGVASVRSWYDTVQSTLVNVYVDLVVFTRIAGTSYTGSGGY